ncbi:hypothetical protein WDW37_21625 [Bdellovibrionota bacterium FG-1]
MLHSKSVESFYASPSHLYQGLLLTPLQKALHPIHSEFKHLPE